MIFFRLSVKEKTFFTPSRNFFRFALLLFVGDDDDDGAIVVEISLDTFLAMLFGITVALISLCSMHGSLFSIQFSSYYTRRIDIGSVQDSAQNHSKM